MGATPKPVHVFSRRELVPVRLAVPIDSHARAARGEDYALRMTGFALMEHMLARKCRLTPALELYVDRGTALWVGLATPSPDCPPKTRVETVGLARLGRVVDECMHLANVDGAPLPQALLRPTGHEVKVRAKLYKGANQGRIVSRLLGELTDWLENNDLVLFTWSKPKVTRERAGQAGYVAVTVHVWGRTSDPAHYRI